MRTQVTLAGAVDRIQEHGELLGVLALSGLTLLYRLAPMNRGLGQDELFSAMQFIEVPSILRTIFYNIAFNNHILYSLMARISESLLGRSEWALRLPALLLGTATVAVFYFFARPLLGRIPALLGALLLALSPAHIAWSTQARGYSALIFFTLLSSFFYLKLFEQPTRRNAFFFSIASVLGIYVHLYAALVLLVQILLFALVYVRQPAAQKGERRTKALPVRLFAISFLAIIFFSFVLYLPVLVIILRDLAGRGRSEFNPRFPLEVFQDLGGSDSFLIIAGIVLISVWGWCALRKSFQFAAYYFAALLVVPLVTMWLVRPFDLYTRFFAYWLPYLVVFFVAGLVSLVSLAQSRWIGAPRLGQYLIPSTAAMIVLIIVLNWMINTQARTADEGYREVSRNVMQGASSLATFCAIGGARSVWQYYIDKPIVNPQTLQELQELAQRTPEVRCVYYPASWEDRDQTEIAEFLFTHSTWSQVKELTWFVYRASG